MMKLGFSSLVCPEWDLETIVSNASAMGFDGVELHGLRGGPDRPGIPELSSHPDQVREMFKERNVELVCLGTSATLDSKHRAEIARQKATITEFAELAARLGCPYVCIQAGKVQRWDNRQLALSRIAEALISIVPVLSRYGVTLLVENGGDFVGSGDLWSLIDPAAHPSVRACWNQCHAMTGGERATVSIPCLGSKLDLIHLCDATFDDRSVMLGYKPLGEGDTEVARQIELLRGIIYDRYLVFDWPRLSVQSLPAAEFILPEVAKYLRGCVDEKQAILSAYKGDKQAPKLASRVAVSEVA